MPSRHSALDGPAILQVGLTGRESPQEPPRKLGVHRWGHSAPHPRRTIPLSSRWPGPRRAWSSRRSLEASICTSSRCKLVLMSGPSARETTHSADERSECLRGGVIGVMQGVRSLKHVSEGAPVVKPKASFGVVDIFI